MNRARVIVPLLVAGLGGAVIALAATGGAGNHSLTTTVYQRSASVPSTLPTSLTSSRGMTISQIFQQDGPGVVDIVVTQNVNGGLFGAPQQQQGEGAGVVYDKNGDILTDQHVVDGASSISVTFENGFKVSARVVGTDPSTDVAVIHVNAPSSQLHPIAFADSATAQVGDPVVAIGSPFSYPETVTSGIVSAVARSITAPNGFTITGSIQTDAAINPGNSGGPLLDANGHVLGLADQIQTNTTNPTTGEGQSSGVGFAIASNMVAHIASEIIAGTPIHHPYVGVELNGASIGAAEVQSVTAGGPAAAAGIQPNDLVTAINGKRITSTQQFIETVDRFKPGETITLTVERGGSTLHPKLTLGNRPSQAPTGG